MLRSPGDPFLPGLWAYGRPVHEGGCSGERGVTDRCGRRPFADEWLRIAKAMSNA
jgi:hypothetical protein